MSAGKMGELPGRDPLGTMRGVRSCEGECDSSHAVTGPAEKSLGTRVASADWEGVF